MKNKYSDNIEMRLNNKEIDTLIRKKTIKGMAVGAILGTLLTGSIAVTAVTLTAKEIKYTPSNQKYTATNVEEAMNELYDISTELAGRSEVIDLGTGTSFDLTSYEGYENFTLENNFIYGIKQTNNAGPANLWYSSNPENIYIRYYGMSVSASYNNGILTLTKTGGRFGSSHMTSGDTYSTNHDAVLFVYLIPGGINKTTIQ